MADRFAIANGGFNNSAIWSTTPTGAGGASIPTIGDDAIANNRTITVSANAACDWVRNDTKGGATAGGTFNLASGITLTANVTAAVAACVTLPAGAGPANLIGNIVTAGTNGVNNSSTGTLNVTGNVTGSTTGNAFYGIANVTTGTVNISGSCFGGLGGNAFAIDNQAGGTVNILGNVIANSTTNTSFGARNNSTGTLNVIGNVIGAVATGLSNTTTGTINVTGNVVGGTSTLFGINNAGAGFVYVYGTVTGGTGSGATGLNNASTGLVYCTKAVGNGFGLGSVGIAGIAQGLANSQNGRAYVEQVEFGPRGATPISGPVYILPSNQNTLTGYTTALGTPVTFYNSLSVSGLLPPTSSVRLGTVYNVGNSTGTMAVPSASAVQFGVAVDNTTGTAALQPQDVWGYARLSATQVNSMGDRLRNVATTQSVGQQIASFNL